MTGRERLKLIIRRVAAAILFYSGMNAIYRLLVRRSQPVILMYHRIIDPADVDETSPQPGMYVTKETFEMQMKHLSKLYNVVSLENLVEAVKNGRGLHRNACVITFDDGWKDNYSHAFPILKKYDLPATIFLVSQYVGTDQRSLPKKVFFLSLDEINEMSQSTITFGSHTKSHALLTRVSKKEATGEIVESKQEIEKRLSKPCQTFCYPNGDYNDEIKSIVREHYSCALTVEHGFVKPGDDLFGLKRLGIHNDISCTKAMFACRISGILDILSLWG